MCLTDLAVQLFAFGERSFDRCVTSSGLQGFCVCLQLDTVWLVCVARFFASASPFSRDAEAKAREHVAVVHHMATFS